MDDGKLPLSADTINALSQAMGALVFATVRRLPPEQREAFCEDLASMAKMAEAAGKSALEALLIDLYRAAQTAPPEPRR